jgi:hypothetical protein
MGYDPGVKTKNSGVEPDHVPKTTDEWPFFPEKAPPCLKDVQGIKKY